MTRKRSSPGCPAPARCVETTATGLAVLLRREIERAIAHVFTVTLPDLNVSRRGKAPVALARQAAMYIAHVGVGLSMTEVGQLFRRDRTTVAHACNVIEDRRDEPSFDYALQCLEGIVLHHLYLCAGPRHSHS